MKAEKDVVKGGETGLSSDISIITAEINTYKRIAGEAIFEIGRRLKHVKENDLAHGEFGKWLEEVEINRRVAQQFMKVYEELGDPKTRTSSHLGLEALYQLATLPPEQRQVPHLTSKGEQKTPDEMTVRELRELKRQLREAEQAKEQAERQAEMARKSEQIATSKYEELSQKEPEVRVETRTEYVERIPDDYEELKRKAKEYDVLSHDRTMDNPYGVELGLRLYDAIDKLSEWQKEYAWLADDVDELRTLAKMDSNMKREYERVNKFWRTLSEIFTEDNVIDGEFIEIK